MTSRVAWQECNYRQMHSYQILLDDEDPQVKSTEYRPSSLQQQLSSVQWRRNRGTGGSMNRGPYLLGLPSPDQKIFTQEKNTPLLKNIKTLGVGGLHRFPDLVAGPRAPCKAPPPLSALRASSFSHWGPAEGIEGPQVTTMAPQSLATPLILTTIRVLRCLDVA